jgi:S1-C subfamily serine protease
MFDFNTLAAVVRRAPWITSRNQPEKCAFGHTSAPPLVRAKRGSAAEITRAYSLLESPAVSRHVETEGDAGWMTRPGPRLWATLLLSLILTVSAVRDCPAAAPDVPTMLAQVSLAVVTIHTEKSHGVTQGSGFVVDTEGLIVTAHHVIAGATRAHVVLPNGAALEVSGIVAADPAHDVALLRVDARGDLRAVTLGDSEVMRRGDRVFVLGSPQGLELTATDGIVSAPVRRSPGGRESLQITAPIFGGSSGGPVLTAEGEVIGVARSYHRDAQSLTFATPINVVKPLLAVKGRAALPFPPASPPSP